MNWSIGFWTLALVNLGVIAGLVIFALRAVRHGEVAAHRRAMRGAASLVACFLAAYLVKRLLLGPEDKSAWSAFALYNLYLHEALVFTMLGAGAAALLAARHFARTDEITGATHGPRAWHRRLGRIAVCTCLASFFTACGILARMWMIQLR